jgi:alpha-1,3-fucosyltransferase
MVFTVKRFREFSDGHIVTKSQQSRLYFYILSLILLIFLYCLASINSPNFLLKKGMITFFPISNNDDYSFNTNYGTRKLKLILFWTNFFLTSDYGFGTGHDPFINAKCRVSNCMITNDRTLVNQSDALIFHPINFQPDDLPPYRMSFQRYIFFFLEAAANHRNLPVFKNPATNKEFFNWTMTYRRDSDIYASYYGSILRKAVNVQTLKKLPSTFLPGDFPPNPASFWQYIGLNQSKNHPVLTNKTKLVSWFVTNCETDSLREVFFEEMAKYISIDIYGGCGALNCPPWNSNECDKLLKYYKFYISAENAICADYVTEKFYRALEMGVIPIVYGGADYSAYAPTHSYINAADFESPKALSDYLLLLDHNPRLYSKYLDWKKDWEVIRYPLDSWCDLCEKLNAPSLGRQHTKIYENIAHWYDSKVPCLPGTSLITKYGLS